MITKPPTPPLPPCPAVLMDTNAHCVLVYDRRVKWATVILNDASGPYVKELSISKLDHEFTRPLYVEPHDVLFGAMSFYKNLLSSSTKSRKVAAVLTEIIEMNLEKLDELKMAELVARYNVLAPLAGKNRVIKFGDKPLAIKQIRALADTLPAEDVAALDEPQVNDADTSNPLKGPKTEAILKRIAAEQSGAKPEKKAKTPKEPKAPKAPTEKKPRAKDLFIELIMAGKLSDDQIFAEVQKKFDLDEKKRNYVGWYRNHLKKEGKNPPGPIGGDKPKSKDGAAFAQKMRNAKAAKASVKTPTKKAAKKK